MKIRNHTEERRAKRARNKAIINKRKMSGCVLCGYNKCLNSLHFHHVGDEKDFGLSSAQSRSITNVIKEMDKCIVVCANCHGEIHAEQLSEFENIKRQKRDKEDRQLKFNFQ